MANIALTTACNLDCDYCFALSDTSHATGRREDMSMERFSEALDFLSRSGITEARLLGGEPALHPRFPEMIELALDRGFHAVVFSNAIMPEAALGAIERASPDRISVLVNARAEAGHKPAQWTRVRMAYERLGSRVMLGYNIASRVPELGFLASHVEQFGLKRSLRLGLAHPRVDGGNAHLRPSDYPSIGRRIADFAAVCRDAGISLDFDCGFVPCMFPPGVAEALGIPEFGNRCNPILDLLPDGNFISCYPLGPLGAEPLTQIISAAELRKRFSEGFAGMRAATLYPHCVSCGWRAEGKCSGGCLASSLRRRRSSPFRSSASGGEPPYKAMPASVPYVDQPLEFWKELARKYGPEIQEVYFPPPVSVIGSGRPEQPSLHSEEFLRRAPLRKAVLLNAITLAAPVEEVAPRILEMLRRYRGEYGIHSATVSNLSLAETIREAMPDLPLTASVLMDVFQPNQAMLLNGIFDTLVPSSRAVRDLAALKALRAAFKGRIRLLVNEACLSGCLHRVQHFHEMGSGVPGPKSLCDGLIEREPWLRLTGSWILPQHLSHYEAACDEIKLAGRVTLSEASRYRRVLEGYLRRRPLMPHEIGGGPAGPVEPVEITPEFVHKTSRCGQNCHACSYCKEYYESARMPVRQELPLVQIQGAVWSTGVSV